MTQITHDVGASLLRQRKKEAHKGDYGFLTALCGCTFYRGAASLCVDSALRSGAGVVRLASVEAVIGAVAVRCPEAILFPLPEQEGQIAWTGEDAPRALLSQKTDAFVMGCGCPKGAATAAWTQALLRQTACPLLLDAGALTSLFAYGEPQALQAAAGRTVVTPHLGEMSAMTGLSPTEIAKRMEETALEFAQTYGCVTVLKSHRTVIATPKGGLWESTLGSCGLARGGSGDCLAGMLASFLCQGYDIETAAVLGVWLHGMASQAAEQSHTAYAMLPRELPDAIPQVFARMREHR